MAKYYGWSALTSTLRYLRDNCDAIYLANGAGKSYATLTGANGYIASANFTVSTPASNFIIGSGSLGTPNGAAVMTMQAINSVGPIEGSGTADHLYMVRVSGSTILHVTTVSAQVLSSGNTVNIGSWTISAVGSASNS